MTNASRCWRIALLASGLAVGCQNPPPRPDPAEKLERVEPAPAVASLATEARRTFDTRCVVCHGATGKGDGPGGVALNPKPRAFGDATWQGSVDDARLAKVIVEGGPALKLSAGMAPNPDLAGKPDLVSELVKIVRGFKK